MNFSIAIAVFIIVLIVYIHICFHHKMSNNLDVYEMDDIVTKDKFEDILNTRQPVVFNFSNKLIFEFNEALFDEYANINLNVHKCLDDDIVFTPVQTAIASKLFKSKQLYISERNASFLEKSKMLNNMNRCDGHLRPYALSNSYYDLITGNSESYTTLRHEICYRNFFIVTSGSVCVKLFPPIYKETLQHTDDYEKFMFYSKINPWDVKFPYTESFSQSKCIDISLEKGQIISIPAYWYYSFMLKEESTFITSFKYNTFFNELATIQYNALFFLQNQNTTYKFVKEKKNKKIPKKEKRENKNKKTENNSHSKDFILKNDVKM
jgi:hypothetical protein